MMANVGGAPAGILTLLGDLRRELPERDARCRATADKLDLYVSDELDGIDVKLRHPSVWEHLKGCGSCRREYDSLLELLVAEMASELPELPEGHEALSANESMLEPWRVTIRSASGSDAGNLVFVFSPAYLEQSLFPASRSASSYRGSAQPVSGTALLASFDSDTPLGEVIIDVEAIPVSDDPWQRILQITAKTECSPTAAELHWGDRTWRGTFDRDGMISLGPVSLGALAEYGPEQFRLDIALGS